MMSAKCNSDRSSWSVGTDRCISQRISIPTVKSEGCLSGCHGIQVFFHRLLSAPQKSKKLFDVQETMNWKVDADLPRGHLALGFQ